MPKGMVEKARDSDRDTFYKSTMTKYETSKFKRQHLLGWRYSFIF